MSEVFNENCVLVLLGVFFWTFSAGVTTHCWLAAARPSDALSSGIL